MPNTSARPALRLRQSPEFILSPSRGTRSAAFWSNQRSNCCHDNGHELRSPSCVAPSFTPELDVGRSLRTSTPVVPPSSPDCSADSSLTAGERQPPDEWKLLARSRLRWNTASRHTQARRITNVRQTQAMSLPKARVQDSGSGCGDGAGKPRGRSRALIVIPTDPPSTITLSAFEEHSAPSEEDANTSRRGARPANNSVRRTGKLIMNNGFNDPKTRTNKSFSYPKATAKKESSYSQATTNKDSTESKVTTEKSSNDPKESTNNGFRIPKVTISRTNSDPNASANICYSDSETKDCLCDPKNEEHSDPVLTPDKCYLSTKGSKTNDFIDYEKLADKTRANSAVFGCECMDNFAEVIVQPKITRRCQSARPAKVQPCFAAPFVKPNSSRRCQSARPVGVRCIHAEPIVKPKSFPRRCQSARPVGVRCIHTEPIVEPKSSPRRCQSARPAVNQNRRPERSASAVNVLTCQVEQQQKNRNIYGNEKEFAKWVEERMDATGSVTNVTNITNKDVLKITS
ncbi:hypothetical protein LSAT2_029370 [Lamellibrachia satsuma]|nr:hypothetical protein LSAT2_029370 [Lamellibrachia satsuma]